MRLVAKFFNHSKIQVFQMVTAISLKISTYLLFIQALTLVIIALI
jgi:hypothetical protein